MVIWRVMWRSLKYYFNVHNKMVFNKLGRLLFPFRVKAWKRVTSGYQDGAKNTDFGFLPPSKDTSTLFILPLPDQAKPLIC